MIGLINNMELINEMIKYIESSEQTIDFEFGYCREAEEIIKDGDMPDVYYKLLEYKESLKYNQCCGKCKKEVINNE